MNIVKIKVCYDNCLNEAELHLINDCNCIIKLYIENKCILTAEGGDFFECFKRMRLLDKSVVYYCKGAKINVISSRMTRQMTKGLSVYETNLGRPARKEDLVNIFDYEDEGLSSDPCEQNEYEVRWFTSLSS